MATAITTFKNGSGEYVATDGYGNSATCPDPVRDPNPHRGAAIALITKLGYFSEWVQGDLPDGTQVFVQKHPELAVAFKVKAPVTK